MKIRPVGAEMFHAHERRQTDIHDKANGRFSEFCERAQKFISVIYGDNVP